MRANTVFDVIHAKSVPYEASVLFFSFQEAEDFADPGQYFPKQSRSMGRLTYNQTCLLS
jgi:hypothetical protein